jgi:hypothetical protein
VIRAAAGVWIVGLLTAVPWATWHLFFQAPREQYALLITFILFWIFGYWGLVGPIVSIVKVRSVMRALQAATSRDDFIATLRSPEARDVFIDHLAADNGIPKFLARKVYDRLAASLRDIPAS